MHQSLGLPQSTPSPIVPGVRNPAMSGKYSAIVATQASAFDSFSRDDACQFAEHCIDALEPGGIAVLFFNPQAFQFQPLEHVFANVPFDRLPLPLLGNGVVFKPQNER